MIPEEEKVAEEIVTRGLASMLSPEAAPSPGERLTRRQGVVTALATGPPPTLTVTVGNTPIPSVRFFDWYRPAVGDVVFLDFDGTTPVVIGILAATSVSRAGPYCLVERVTDQTVADATEVPADWDGEVRDLLGMHAAGSSAIDVSHTGIWEVGYSGRFNVEVSTRYSYLRKNGADLGAGRSGADRTNDSRALKGVVNLPLVAGDSLSLIVFQNNGTPRTWLTGSMLWARLIAP